MAYDLVTGQRTFCVGLSGVLNESVIEIPFRDSTGTEMNCNYFTLDAILDGETGNTGAIVAEVSGVYHKGNMILNTVSGLNSTLEGSGICGIAKTISNDAGTGPVEWHGSNGEVCTGVKLQTQIDAGSVTVVITYGNLLALNSHRLAQSYDAGS